MAFVTSLPDKPAMGTTPVLDTKHHRWLPALVAPLKIYPHTLACVDTATGRFAQATGASTVLFDGIVEQDFAVTYDVAADKTQQVRIDRPLKIRIAITDNCTDADLLKKVYIVPNRDDAVTKTVPGSGNVTAIGTIDYVHSANDVTVKLSYQTL